jgi:hypothetical protein
MAPATGERPDQLQNLVMSQRIQRTPRADTTRATILDRTAKCQPQLNLGRRRSIMGPWLRRP